MVVTMEQSRESQSPQRVEGHQPAESPQLQKNSSQLGEGDDVQQGVAEGGGVEAEDMVHGGAPPSHGDASWKSNAEDSVSSEQRPQQQGSQEGMESQIREEESAEISDADWRRRYELLVAERTREKEDALRLRADTENLRRRLIKEKTESAKYALEGCMAALLPCLDSLEQALSASAVKGAHGDGKALTEGVQLVYKQLFGALEKYGLEKVESSGQPFDPECHQAVRTEPSSQVQVETVMEVYQNGYRMHERLLRPAMVRVFSPDPSADKEPSAEKTPSQ